LSAAVHLACDACFALTAPAFAPSCLPFFLHRTLALKLQISRSVRRGAFTPLRGWRMQAKRFGPGPFDLTFQG
jgi:hypothetical protein